MDHCVSVLQQGLWDDCPDFRPPAVAHLSFSGHQPQRPDPRTLLGEVQVHALRRPAELSLQVTHRKLHAVRANAANRVAHPVAFLEPLLAPVHHDLVGAEGHSLPAFVEHGFHGELLLAGILPDNDSCAWR